MEVDTTTSISEQNDNRINGLLDYHAPKPSKKFKGMSLEKLRESVKKQIDINIEERAKDGGTEQPSIMKKMDDLKKPYKPPKLIVTVKYAVMHAKENEKKSAESPAQTTEQPAQKWKQLAQKKEQPMQKRMPSPQKQEQDKQARDITKPASSNLDKMTVTTSLFPNKEETKQPPKTQVTHVRPASPVFVPQPKPIRVAYIEEIEEDETVIKFDSPDPQSEAEEIENSNSRLIVPINKTYPVIQKVKILPKRPENVILKEDGEEMQKKYYPFPMFKTPYGWLSESMLPKNRNNIGFHFSTVNMAPKPTIYVPWSNNTSMRKPSFEKLIKKHGNTRNERSKFPYESGRNNLRKNSAPETKDRRPLISPISRESSFMKSPGDKNQPTAKMDKSNYKYMETKFKANRTARVGQRGGKNGNQVLRWPESIKLRERMRHLNLVRSESALEGAFDDEMRSRSVEGI